MVQDFFYDKYHLYLDSLKINLTLIQYRWIMRGFVLSVLSVVFVCCNLLGQTVEPSAAVGKDILQLEFETLYSVEKSATLKNTTWNIPNVLVRYGLSDNVELQLHTPFTKDRCFENNGLTSTIFSFKEVELGVSLNLWGQRNIRPEAAILVRAISATESFGFKEIGNMVSLNFSNTIGQKFTLGYNIGTTTDLDKHTSGFYVLNLDYAPNPKIHFFVENTVNFNWDSMRSNCIGLGAGFKMGGNLFVDFSAAKSLLHDMFYTGAIVTWAINAKKP